MFAASKSGRAATATDPYFPYVPLLLNTTSTNGQQNNTFLDSSTNNFTLTRSGTPTQGSVTPYWPNGYWGNYFNGTSFFTTPSSSGTTLGAGNFTVEFWFFATGTTGQGSFGGEQGFVGSGSSGASRWTIRLNNFTNKVLNIWLNTPSNVVAGTTIIKFNTWYHVAMVRNGTGAGSLKLYLNGLVEISTNNAYTVPADSLVIGRTYTDFTNNGENTNGYISNLRIVPGVAVYSGTSTTVANFVVPTAPLAITQSSGANISAITGTQTGVLTCQSNRFIDNATTPNILTVGGLPQAQPFQPFSPAASYTTAVYGGSTYLNGSTDYLSAGTSTTAFAFGASVDFTVECWVYLTAYSSGGTLGGGLVGTTGGANTGWFINSGQDINTLRITSNASGSWADNITVAAGNGLPLNQWAHIAFVRNGGNLTLYKNGVSVASMTGASAYNFTSPNNLAYIGYTLDGGGSPRYVPGYISNARIVKGTAVYTSAFTPPTAPVTAITNTSLLTNFTNAGIYDAAVQNNELTAGSAQASTTQFKWSPTSMKFNGTTDYLTTIDGPQLQLGTGDFTIDGWVYLSAIGVAYGIISKGTATTGWSVNVTTLNKLQFSYTASNLTGTTSLATGTWYYFAVVRSGSATGNLKVYLNGTVDATSGGAVTDAFTQTNTLYVGADRVGMSLLSGYLQDVRITKYARTITTPTAAFPTR